MFDVAWLVVASMFDAVAHCYRRCHRAMRCGKEWHYCRSCCCCRHCGTQDMKQLVHYWARSQHMVLLQPFSCCPHCRCATQCVNTLLLPDGWLPPKPSSYGFGVAASTSGFPARLCGNSNVRPLLHVCNMSRTAARARCSWRSSVDRCSCSASEGFG
jgi:hypothetical protein